MKCPECGKEAEECKEIVSEEPVYICPECDHIMIGLRVLCLAV